MNEYSKTAGSMNEWMNNYHQTAGFSGQELGLVFVSSYTALHRGARAVPVELDPTKTFFFLFSKKKHSLCKMKFKKIYMFW